MLVRDNKYIPAEDKDFFILLRIGLWQKVEEPLSPSPDWPYIYRLSCEQTVQGIVADGVAIYRSQHPNLQITQEQNDLFLSATAQIVRQNYKVNQTQLRLNALFSEAGIPFYVVKGQEAAKNYPKPMLRCSGDIDYLLSLSSIPQAQQVLAPLASHIGTYETYLKHQDYEIDGIEVELHGALHPRLGTKIDKVLDQLQADVFNEIETIETFNAVYVLLHCLQHFHWSGLGIRQIADWCMLLAKSKRTCGEPACTEPVECKSINFNRVQQAISEMGIQTESGNFLQFSTQWLGLDFGKDVSLDVERSDPSRTPTRSEEFERIFAQMLVKDFGSLQQLWLECKSSGNMGHNKEHEDRIPNTILRVSAAWLYNLKVYFKTRKVSPSVSRRLLRVKFNEYKKQL